MEHEERIARALERPDQGSESLLEQGVHEGRMGGPFRLSLQRLRVVPRWSTRPQDNECVFHSTSELAAPLPAVQLLSGAHLEIPHKVRRHKPAEVSRHYEAEQTKGQPPP